MKFIILNEECVVMCIHISQYYGLGEQVKKLSKSQKKWRIVDHNKIKVKQITEEMENSGPQLLVM